MCKDIDNDETSKPSQEVQLINNELEGIVKEYDFNGNVSKATPYKNGKKHGIEKVYNVDYIRTLVGEGILIRETPYIDDNQHDIEKEYYEENGKIRSEVEYKNDKLESITKGYHKNGNSRILQHIKMIKGMV